MSAARESVYLPLVFLTVAFFGGMRMGAHVAFVPPPLFSLVLALLVLALLVKSGAFAPDEIVGPRRSPLANMNGLALLVALFAATAQAFNLATPSSGLPLVLFDTLLFVLLVNTLVAAPDRSRVLRSLMVIFGSAFILKFVVLASLSDPAGGRTKRVLQLLLEGITFGSLIQEPLHPASGYVAFVVLLLYLVGVAALPRRISPATFVLPPHG